MKNPTVLFTGPKTVEVKDVPVPKAGPDQVVVHTRRTLISTGTETTILKAEYAPDSSWAAWVKYPFNPGYDNIGDIVEVGPGVDKSLLGKRVSSYGTHTMYALVSTREIRPITQKISDDHAAFGTIADIVFNAVRRGQPEWGDSAVVYGMGLLGQFATRALHFAGVRPVFAVDVAEARLNLLPKLPGFVTINPKKQKPADVVKEHTKGRMADIAYEITGNPTLIPGEFEALKIQGRMVIVSSPAAPTMFDFNELCNVPSWTIIGAHGKSSPAFETPYNQWTRPRNTEMFFDLVESGELNVEPLISHRAPVEKAPELYKMLLEDRSKAMGVVLEWRD